MLKKIFKTISQYLNILFSDIHNFIYSNFLSSKLTNKIYFFLKKSLGNFSALIFLILIFYNFYNGISFDIGLLSLTISFLISFALSHFILSDFKYSANIFISLFQRLIIYLLIFIIGAAFFSFAFYLFSFFNINLIQTAYCSSGEEGNLTNKFSDKEVLTVKTETDDTNNEYYNFKIEKKLFENALQTVAETSKFAANKFIPNLGAGAAAGAAATATIKSTGGLPLFPRAAAIGGSTLITATATKVGLELGATLTQKTELESLIKNSPHADPNPDRIPSPDPNIINSILESNDITSPLQDLLLYSFVLDIMILISIISLLIIIFNRYINSCNLSFFNSIFNKYIPIKYRNWFQKYLNTGIDYNNRFMLIMFIINSIGLILMILLKIFITSELFINIDSHIAVHNYIHSKESFILLFMSNFLNNNRFKIKKSK
jgi:hypothetical protein